MEKRGRFYCAYQKTVASSRLNGRWWLAQGWGRVTSQERLVLERRQALRAQKIILKDFAKFRE